MKQTIETKPFHFKKMLLSHSPGHRCGSGQLLVWLSIFFVGFKQVMPVCTSQDPRSDIHISRATEVAMQEQQAYFYHPQQ